MAPIRNYPCDICNKHNYTSVQRQKHKARQHYCYHCDSFVQVKASHTCNPSQKGYGNISSSTFKLVQAGLNTFRVYSTEVEGTFYSIEKLVTKYRPAIEKLLTDTLSSLRSIKVRLVIQANLVQRKTGEVKHNIFGHHYSIILNPGQIKRFLFEQTAKIIKRLNFYNTGGSSWTVESLPRLDIHIAKYVPLKVGNGIPTPVCYKNKQGLINIPTRENLCFVYCAIACYKKITTAEAGVRMRGYSDFMARNYNEDSATCNFIDFTCLPQTGPVSLHDIDQFESCNTTFSVNVFAHCDEDKCIFPIRLTKLEKTNHMDLMVITDVQNDKSHYIYIYDFDKFMKRKTCKKTYFCKRCLQSFSTVENRSTHYVYCKEYPPQRLSFPNMKSVNYTIGPNEISHTYWVSADFETVMTV